MQPGTWRRLDTIAHRMGVTLEEATEITDHCARQQWADHELHSVRLREGGRRVAVGIRKTIISKQQSAEAEPSTTKWNSRQLSGQQMTNLEKLQHEIYLLGQTIKTRRRLGPRR